MYESERCFTTSNGIPETILGPFNGKEDERYVFYVRGIVICLWVAVCRLVILVKVRILYSKLNVYATEFLRSLLYLDYH